MNKKRLILYIFFLFSNLFLIEYYNVAEAQIAGEAPWIEIRTETKSSDNSITDTTIFATDDAGFNAGDVQIEGATTAGISNLNCVFSPEEMICGLFSGCSLYPHRVNCTLSVDSSGDLYVSVVDVDLQIAYDNELGYLIEEGQSLQSQSSKSSSRGSRAHHIRFTCKDPKAINYNRFGRHDESRCKYPKKVRITEAVIFKLINIL